MYYFRLVFRFIIYILQLKEVCVTSFSGVRHGSCPTPCDVDVKNVNGCHCEITVAQFAGPMSNVICVSLSDGSLHALKHHIWVWDKLVPDESSEGCRTQTHVALDSEEAEEKCSDALHEPQVVELLGVFGVNLLETQ